MTTAEQVAAEVEEWLSDLAAMEPVPGAHGKPVAVRLQPGPRPGEHLVELPGSTRLHVPISVLTGARWVEVSAFVCRNPEENYEEVYRWLLLRNAKLRLVAFSIDPRGDIYVHGRLPIDMVNAEGFDLLLGEALDVADRSFNEIISRGFVTSVRKEYSWRTSRGLSTANLDAFSHLLTDLRDEPDLSSETSSDTKESTTGESD